MSSSSSQNVPSKSSASARAEALEQGGVEIAAPGNERADAAAGLLAHHQADRVSCLFPRREARRPGRHGERLDGQAARRTRRGRGGARPSIQRQLGHRHVAERARGRAAAGNRVRGSTRRRASRRAEDGRLRAAARGRASDRARRRSATTPSIGTWRTVAGAVSERIHLQLVADIGRGVQQEPAAAVGADGGGRLGAGYGGGGIAACGAAGRAPAVPLGKAAAGGAAEQDDVHAEKRRGRAQPRRQEDAVTSCPRTRLLPSVTATTVNSGFVHAIERLLVSPLPRVGIPNRSAL